MNLLADAYSSYVNFWIDYKAKVDFLKNIFEQGYLSCDEFRYLSKDFLDNIDKFPIFPYFYNIMTKTDYVNIVKIYNIASDNVDDLEVTLTFNPGVIKQKSIYDFIPRNINAIIDYAAFQYAYCSNINSLFNKDLIFKSFVFENNRRNFFSDLYVERYKLMGNNQSCGFENSSVIILEALRSLLFVVSSQSCDFMSRLQSYLTFFNENGDPNLKVNNNILNDNFQNFINTYKGAMSSTLVGSICKLLYSYLMLNDSLKEALETIVKNQLSNFYTIFSNFSSSINKTMIYEMCSICSDLFFGGVSLNILGQIHDNQNIIDTSVVSSYSKYENDLIFGYIKNISTSDFELYLFLAFLYKFWYYKFINVLPLCLQRCVEDVIKPPDDISVPYEEFITIINKLYDANPVLTNPGFYPPHYEFPNSIVNYNNLRDYLVSTFTLSYFSQFCNYYSVPFFTCILYFIKKLDEFFSKHEYVIWTYDLFNSIFTYLRDNGYVKYDVNWANYLDLVNIYLKLFLRYHLINNNLFPTFINNFNILFNRVISNTTHYYYPYPLQGVFDVHIFIPSAYDINFTFKTLVTQSFINCERQFFENLLLSTLTREVIYAAFSEFVVR